MRLQAITLLVTGSLVSGLREGSLRQRSGRKIADVSDLLKRGVSCEKDGKTFCHANIVRQYGSTYGQICSNGEILLMRMPVGYTGPKVCEDDDGSIYCPGVIPGTETVFVEQWCVDGDIFYINKLTGNKFKKGRLSGSKNNKDKKKTEEEKEKTTEVSKTSTTSILTTAPTTTTITPTTTTSTTTRKRNIRRSTTTTRSEEPTTTTTKPSTTTTTTSTTTFKELEVVADDIINEFETEEEEILGNDVEAPEFTVEYVNTVLEDSVPNVKVLQCWSQFNICFIQVGPAPPITSIP